MISARLLASSFALALLAAACAVPAPHGRGTVLDRSGQQALTPGQVRDLLAEGNARFAAGHATLQDGPAQVHASATGQYPMAFVLGCVDSRVPPEAVFDCGLGDLFVGRVAGNFENTDLLGSMEFATKLSGARLIVVLGHTNCGAIKGACDGAQLGNLTELLARLRPAVDATHDVPGDRSSKNEAFVDAVTRTNVLRTLEEIDARSAVIHELVQQGQLQVVGGIYDLQTGRVDWL